MAMTSAERSRRYRERKGSTPRDGLVECGSISAYRRHVRHNKKLKEQGLEPLEIDDDCRNAWNEYQRNWTKTRRDEVSAEDPSDPSETAGAGAEGPDDGISGDGLGGVQPES